MYIERNNDDSKNDIIFDSVFNFFSCSLENELYKFFFIYFFV